jgi:hypothetical protein
LPLGKCWILGIKSENVVQRFGSQAEKSNVFESALTVRKDGERRTIGQSGRRSAIDGNCICKGWLSQTKARRDPGMRTAGGEQVRLIRDG